MKIEHATYVRSAHTEADLIDDGRPEIAFAGRSNVGKSTLLNCLLGKQGLARTSSTPGRTQAVNYFLVDDRCWFVDLPGYGWARAAKSERRSWAVLMESYLARPKAQRRVLLLVDGKVGATALDSQAVEYLRDLGADFAVVATKIDRLPRGSRARALAEVRETLDLAPGEPVVGFSSRSGEGTHELWRTIGEFCTSATARREAR